MTAHSQDPNAANGVTLIHESARVAEAVGRNDLAVALMRSGVRLARQHQLNPKPYRLVEAESIIGGPDTDDADSSSLLDVVERARHALDEI